MYWREERFGRGDTISDLLARLSVNDQEARVFLARIKRDLMGKRPPKPASTLREVATVTTATKGDDE